MTNKMKITLGLVSIAFTIVSMVFSTEAAIEASQDVLTAVAAAVGMHGMPAPITLVMLIIPLVCLYLSFKNRGHS